MKAKMLTFTKQDSPIHRLLRRYEVDFICSVVCDGDDYI